MIEAAKRPTRGRLFRNFEGLDTLGERGVQLSGGRAPAHAIARAILKDPDLLILDEATVHWTARRSARCSVLWTSWTATQLSCHCPPPQHLKRQSHLRLEEGRAVEEGTHDELMTQGGHYALVENQNLPLRINTAVRRTFSPWGRPGAYPYHRTVKPKTEPT